MIVVVAKLIHYNNEYIIMIYNNQPAGSSIYLHYYLKVFVFTRNGGTPDGVVNRAQQGPALHMPRMQLGGPASLGVNTCVFGLSPVTTYHP
eukprot:922493-Pyramimonas_sp.AAC.1